jgi:2-phospho-L-lactate guanylyltransferase
VVREQGDVERGARSWQDHGVLHSPDWAAVVPVRGGPLAKSRLRLPAAIRDALAEAFARDTVAALREGVPGMPVLVVTGSSEVAAWAEGDGCLVVADPGDGLDAAVAAGVAAAGTAGARRVAVVLGDHPALTPLEVARALDTVADVEAAVVPDAEGSGTALLALPSGTPRRTAFGPGSARAHEALGFTVRHLDLPGLLRDVDDAADLAAAVRLGVGPRTTAALRRATLPGVQATIHRAPDGEDRGSALLDDGVEVDLPPDAAAAGGLRHLRVGQRVSLELDGSGRAATRVWIVGIGPGETIR